MTSATDAPDPATAADEFLAALREQVACYERLDALSHEQARHVSAGDAERLLGVLEQRASLAARAAEFERELIDTKRRWPVSAGAWSALDRRAAEALLREARRLLASMTARDGSDVRQLQDRGRTAVAGQHRGAMANQRAVRQISRRHAAAAYARPTLSMDAQR